MGLSKKIMAGLAAAATLLAGLAVGATAVNAVEGDSTVEADDNLSKITLTASNADQFKTSSGIRAFRYAKLADYKFDSSGKPYLETTDSNQKQTIISALKDAGLTPDGNMDPFTWLGSQSVDTINKGDTWRQFVENDALRDLATHDVTPTLDGTALTFDFTNTTPGGRGLYLIVDQTTPDPQFADSDPAKPGCTITYGKMQAILIGTKLDGVGNGSGELDIQGLVFGDLATGTAEQKQTGSENCLPKPGFTKVGDDGNTPLNGVEFSVYTAKPGATDAEFTTGALAGQIDSTKFDAYSQFGDSKTNILTSDKNGKVDFGTLPAGTYYVYESKMPTASDGKQYLADYRAVLKIEVFAGDQTKNAYYTVTDLNEHGLLTGDATNGYKYKNITSIIHLPLTGAAGTALFAVVAVLLAGGAGVTFVRSRAVKRDLR